MDILKRPYEISLWEDILVFDIFELVEVTFGGNLVYEKNKYYYNPYEEDQNQVNQFILDSSSSMTQNRQYYKIGNKLDQQEGSLESKDYGTEVIVFQYYKERKICIIGSNTMNTPIRAHEPSLVSNVNGSNTLTFNMYSHYWDENLEEMVSNPFLKLLVNERKIKLRDGIFGEDDTKWYDLVIKNIQEDSESKVFTYTAKDLFINELSKSGFNLEFDTELENNTGTVVELGERILAESDWQIKPGVSDTIRQYIEEPLYKVILESNLTKSLKAKDMLNDKAELVLKGGETIYVFYNCIVNKTPYLQFLYSESGSFEIDDNSVIISESNWFLTSVSYNDDGSPSFTQIGANELRQMSISQEYRGNRLVRKAITKYDASTDKYVALYEDEDNQQIYGFIETDYASPANTRSFVTNGSNFTSDTGWQVGVIKSSSQDEDNTEDNDGVVLPELNLVSVPDILDIKEGEVAKSYLKFATTAEKQSLINSGIADHRQYIDNFAVGEEYIFRIKYGVEDTDNEGRIIVKGPRVKLDFKICEYSTLNGEYTPLETYFTGTIVPPQEPQPRKYDYFFTKVTCEKSLSYADMINKPKLGLIITPRINPANIYFEDVQFFKYVPAEGYDQINLTSDSYQANTFYFKDNNAYVLDTSESFDSQKTYYCRRDYLLPDEIKEAQIIETYCYYYPNPSYGSEDDIRYAYRGITPGPYSEVYDNNFEKRRSITAKESNRFNLIQDLCEIFECWARFEIEHNTDGSIKLDDSYRPQKFISFHEYIGKDNFAGFKYGINLKQIQRTVESESIASKIVVKDNSNEFGKNGFCSIARATENPSGENFILDFSYYIQHGMLSLSTLTNDLYLDTNGYIGYYKKLREINILRDEYIEEQAELLSAIADYESTKQVYSTLRDESNEKLVEQKQYLISLTSHTFEVLMDYRTEPTKGEGESDEEYQAKKSIYEWWSNEKVVEVASSIAYLNTIISNYDTLTNNSAVNLANAQNRYDKLTRILSSRDPAEEPVNDSEEQERRFLLEKEELNKQFYKKYSRFLQEGSWISEDHIDDELYYFDACGIARTSTQPQVNYTINVIELSQLEGYENYKFSVGDKTTIEDTEFFGWVMTNGLATPYREEVVVSETTIYFDSPEKNQIKVQNYKTQFEDLFQRMAATTQSVEYSTGKYNKVSNIVEPDGTIAIDTLQNSIANNALVLSNASDQSVQTGKTGITTTSLRNPSEMVRIVSGGIFLSVDGGVTWNTGITGRGINANYLTSGQINTDKINIMNGSFPSFRWDGFGLSAYKFELNQNTRETTNFDYSKFVRLDQYGLYGINGNSEFNASIETDGKIGEEKIWANASFALTWKGFSLKSAGVGGSISITSDNDFQVFNSAGKEQVKIGRLNQEASLYGLRLSNSNGDIVMEQSSNGNLWIRNAINIGTTDTSTVSIGYLDGTKVTKHTNTKDFTGIRDSEIHEVINANNKFIVYEDGSMRATDGYFQGAINATSGQIGGLSIESITSSVATEYEVQIESDSGLVFKNGKGTKILTARVYKGFNEIEDNLSYQWYKDDVEISGANSKTYSVTWGEEAGDTEVTYSCEVTVSEVGNG